MWKIQVKNRKTGKPTGKWQFVLSYKTLNGNYSTVSKTIKPKGKKPTKKEEAAVERILQERAEVKLTGQKVKKLTLGELSERYLKNQEEIVGKKDGIRESTYTGRRAALRFFVKSFGKNTKLESLTPQKVRHTLIQSPYETSTRNNYAKHLISAVRWAKGEGLIESTRCIDGLKLFKVQKIRDASKYYLTQSEARALLEEIPVEYENVVKLMLLSGLRIGEALFLRESDWDEKNKLLTVEGTRHLNRKDGDPKTDSSYRTIHVQPELDSVLYDIKYWALTKKSIFLEKNDKLCVNRFGHPMSYFTVLKKIKKAAEVAGLDKKVTNHTMRHTHATWLYEEGYDLEAIARRLGHAPGQEDRITLAIYAHISEKRRAKEAAELDRISSGWKL